MDRRERHRLEISGAVQGVGFRPFVSRIASELGLTGSVRNSLGGVLVEIEGAPSPCKAFVDRLRVQAPSNAKIREITVSRRPLEDSVEFVILSSDLEPDGAATEILPDLATCPHCVREIFSPKDRRFGYPFTNCTECGPRFSIVHSLPWDRERTTMRAFTMCATCRAEFESVGDRRFHSQPNACPDCGPRLSFTEPSGRTLAESEEALERTAQAIEAGQIVALKGIGGFQLIADARSHDAVETLRVRKHRSAKPFAVMMPDLATVRAHCEMSPLEEGLLRSPRAPIVILQRLPNDEWPLNLAPGNPHLGVMLPYSPLHHLLMRRLGFPVVATSGNRSSEPLCIANEEAFGRLRHIADAFLVHDRPIARPLDDSVVREAAGRELILRAARGYTPISLPGSLTPLLAVGGDLKAALAVTGPFGVRCGPHIGDLETEATQDAFASQIHDFPKLCGVRPRAVACDQHPAYHGTQWVQSYGLTTIAIQHHHAHIAACMAEHDVEEEVLGVAWDGTGYGSDGTIWGGEFLLASRRDFRRLTHLRPFPLPGGDLAVRQPRYAALGLLHEVGISVHDTALAAAFSEQELTTALTQLECALNTPRTSSAGRLFDAVAALLGLRWRNEFEAQAAMELEFAAEPSSGTPPPWTPAPEKQGIIDWEPTIRELLAALKHGVAVSDLAARFLEAMSRAILDMAQSTEIGLVVLSGGCFQNVRLLETTVASLTEAGFTPLWPQRTPPNDGGLALGQAVVAEARLREA